MFLSKGDDVNAKVTVQNKYGISDFSDSGNGALIIVRPDSPKNIQVDFSKTNTLKVTFIWDDGTSDGGA